MPESFGARLRQQRQQRQVTLTAIAEQTKIKLSLLEELERDEVSRWPTGIFRRAFIRAYAHAIGLDPDVVAREFLEFHPDSSGVVSTASAVAPVVDAAQSPPTRLRHFISSAMGSISRLWAVPIRKRHIAFEDPVKTPAPFEADLLAAAQLCASLGRADYTSEMAPLLQEAVRILDAVGLIVWIWDPDAAELRPALAHGYSDKVLAQLPAVKRDANNATAAAFRLAQICEVKGRDLASSAFVAPLMTPAECIGVLAVELQPGREQVGSVRALVTIFAAQLARLIVPARSVEAPTSRRRA